MTVPAGLSMHWQNGIGDFKLGMRGGGGRNRHLFLAFLDPFAAAADVIKGNLECRKGGGGGGGKGKRANIHDNKEEEEGEDREGLLGVTTRYWRICDQVGGKSKKMLSSEIKNDDSDRNFDCVVNGFRPHSFALVLFWGIFRNKLFPTLRWLHLVTKGRKMMGRRGENFSPLP